MFPSKPTGGISLGTRKGMPWYPLKQPRPARPRLNLISGNEKLGLAARLGQYSPSFCPWALPWFLDDNARNTILINTTMVICNLLTLPRYQWSVPQPPRYNIRTCTAMKPFFLLKYTVHWSLIDACGYVPPPTHPHDGSSVDLNAPCTSSGLCDSRQCHCWIKSWTH